MSLRLLIVTLSLLLGLPAVAGPVLDRVKAEKTVHCGAVERPGLADTPAPGRWQGLAIDVCRAVASAVLGSPDLVRFTHYAAPSQFARIGNGEDDLAFLTGTEIRFNDLAGQVLPGPAIFHQTHAVMVRTNSKVQTLTDLAGKKICVFMASPAERSITDYLDRRKITWFPVAFSEEGEMKDSYQSGVCDAMVLERTELAEVLSSRPAGTERDRILDETVVTFPILATTGTTDAQWSAIVAWTIDTLIAGERVETPWYSGGAGAMPVVAPQLGLDAGWQKRVLASVGHYGALYDHHVGKDSPLQLARGPNNDPSKGGLLLAPFLE